MEATLQKKTRAGLKTVSGEWEHKYLSFSIANEIYAVPVTKVREIIGVSRITMLPDMPIHIKGVLNLRGSVVPIIDMRVKYGLVGYDYTERTCIVVLELEGRTSSSLMGIVVDSVNDVLRFPPEAVDPPPPMSGHLMGDCIPGVSTGNGKVHILVDIEKVLADDAFYADGGF